MVVTFVRIDDRMIHGQTVTRWAKEYPCDGLIAVNDASDKKTFVWTKEAFKEKSGKVTESDSRYFLITKNPIDMKEILVDQGYVPGDVKEIIVGPANDRPGAVKLGNNQSITQEEAEAIEAIEKAGYKVKFQLLPDVSIGYWSDFKSKFGF